MKRINYLVFISLFFTCLSQAMLPDLYQAIEDGNLEQVQQLLDAGTNVNIVNVNTNCL